MKNIESLNGELVDTETGECLGDDCPSNEKTNTDIDLLISELEYFKNIESEAKENRNRVELQLSMIAESISGKGKTRRVAGKERVCKVTFKSYEKWDQDSLLKIKMIFGENVFNKYFRISEYKPNVKEIQKLENTAGDPEAIYHEICKAMTSTKGKPQIEIES